MQNIPFIPFDFGANLLQGSQSLTEDQVAKGQDQMRGLLYLASRIGPLETVCRGYQ